MKRHARTGKSTLTSHDLAMFVRDRDENPITVNTIFGTWSSGKGGIGWHTEYDDPHPPVRIRSKRKYQPGN